MATGQRLSGKVALVTGGSRGIGEAIVRRFVEEGASVVIADILDEEGVELAKDLGKPASYLHLDVSCSAGWSDAVASIDEGHGRLDCLVNNAGVLTFSTLDDLPEDTIRKVIEINLVGTIIGTQACLPLLEKSDDASVVNMSSADGLTGANGLTAYCASKFGVRGFTKSAALELGPRGIRVNSIHPGGIFTDMANPQKIPREYYDQGYWIYPAQRSGDAADIGAAAAFLASEDAAYCYGTELAVDGGLTAGHYYMAMPGAPTNPHG